MIADKTVFTAVCLCILLSLVGCYSTGNVLHKGEYTAVLTDDGNRIWIECIEGEIEVNRE